MDLATRPGVVYGIVIGRVANESGHYLLVEEEDPFRLRLGEPKPFYVGVDARAYARAHRGDRHPLGGERA